MESVATVRAQVGSYVAHGNSEDADCVVGFAFGYQQHGDQIKPGVSNQDIAQLIEREFAPLPVIVQFEIADAFENPDLLVHRIERHRQAGVYLDTREVAYQAMAIMQVYGWKRPVLIAHSYHMPRVDAVCSELGLQTIVPASLATIRFDPLSEHPQTRDVAASRAHETRVISEYAEKGWL